MDSWISSYSHMGVTYEHDSYTGETWIAGTRPIIPAPYGYYDDPVKPSTPEQKAKIAAKEAAKQAKAEQSKASREALMARARAMAETMEVTETPEEWKVRKGYVWKAVSPSGTVYTEVIRKVTVEEPEEFVEYRALEMAYGYKMMGR